MTKQLELFEGIYFGQSFEDYKAIPAFSRSYAEDLLFDPTGEEAKHNLENQREVTPAMELGTAIHTVILEPEKFDEIYSSAPTPSDKQFEGKKILFTVNDLKPHLEAFGLKKSGAKAELEASLKGYLDPKKFVFWDDVLATYKKELEIFGKKELSAEHSKIVEGIKKKFDKDEQIQEIFSGGYPEVTLLWKDPETKSFCKCRLDYLRFDAVSELKTFAVKYKKTPLEETIRKEITNNNYNFQFAIYLDALELLIERINKGQAKVFGEVDPEWLKLFLANPNKKSLLVFARTQAPYQLRDYEAQRGSGTPNTYFAVGNAMWKAAIEVHISDLKGAKKRRERVVLEDHLLPGALSQEIRLANSEA